MCCAASKAEKGKVLKSFGKRQTKVMWKVLSENGKAPFWADYEYRPGANRTEVGKAYGGGNGFRGLHVRLEADDNTAIRYTDRGVLMPVVCHRKHLRVADWSEAVFSQVTIRKADWDARFRRNKKGGWSRRRGAHLVAPVKPD